MESFYDQNLSRSDIKDAGLNWYERDDTKRGLLMKEPDFDWSGTGTKEFCGVSGVAVDELDFIIEARSVL